MRLATLSLVLALSVGSSLAIAQNKLAPRTAGKASGQATVSKRQVPQEIMFDGVRLKLAGHESCRGAESWEYLSPDERLNDWTMRLAVRRFEGRHLEAKASADATFASIQLRNELGEMAKGMQAENDRLHVEVVDFLVSEQQNLIEHNLYGYFSIQDGIVVYQFSRRAYVDDEDKTPPRRYAWRKKPASDEPAGAELAKSIGSRRFELFAELLRDDMPLASERTSLRKSMSVPTPDKAISFHQDKSLGRFELIIVGGNEDVIDSRSLPRDQSGWREMINQKIYFRAGMLDKFVESWKQELMKDDPQAKVERQNQADGSVIMTYQSPRNRMAGLCRIIKGPDGFYTMSYQTLPELRDSDAWKTWHKELKAAKLIDNPLLADRP